MQKLIICTPASLEKSARQVILQIAGFDRSDHEIELCCIPDNKARDADYTTSLLKKRFPYGDTQPMIAIKPVKVKEADLNTYFWPITQTDPRGFRKHVLCKFLRLLGYDLVTRKARFLASYEHGTLDALRISRWMSQFEELRFPRWLPERLLVALSFIPAHELANHWELESAHACNYSCIGLNRNRIGGSSSKVENLIAKRFMEIEPSKRLPILSIEDAIENHENILYLEDAAYSGNEFERICLGLLGQPDPYGRSKTKPLPEADTLFAKRIVLKYALIANGGKVAISKFLSQMNLDNIKIDDSASIQLKTLTDDGVSALRGGQLFGDDGTIRNANQFVVMPAFSSEVLWGSSERRKQAIEACRFIGLQLVEAYAAREKRPWPLGLKQEAALGMRGLGLALAFSHSVPKSTLPLFWASGEVTNGDRVVDWTPLFPRAA